jgi:ATP dependent DNA ligase domain
MTSNSSGPSTPQRNRGFVGRFGSENIFHPVAVAVARGGLHQPLDLGLGQVFAGPQVAAALPPRGNCSFYGGRRHQLEVRFCHVIGPSHPHYCSKKTGYRCLIYCTISGANQIVTLCAFDLLSINGDDLRSEPIEDRKHRLSGLLRLPHDGIALNAHYKGAGAIIYRHACTLGCEGIVSKRLGSPYRAGRSAYWIKVKNPDAPAVKREAEQDWN